jgi:hypothetical protein
LREQEPRHLEVVNEFNCILSDELEEEMRDTDVNGTYSRLFEGEL